MSCTEFEVRDFFLGELSEADKAWAIRHLSGCSGCAAELEELRHLRFALESLPDQEPPQRIGFVSDKIFEPSRARRFWNGFWQSGPRLGFASAAMLSAALIFFGMHPVREIRTVQAVSMPVINPQPMIDEAVRKAVAETEARQQQRTDSLVAAVQRKSERDQRELMIRVADSFTMLQKRALVTRASMLNYGGEAQ